MQRSSLGWSLVGLAVVVFFGYALNRGLYVGSAIDVSARDGADKLLYSKSCRYLHFDGVHGTIGREARAREDAEAVSCAPLEGSN
jgi:hypothetical protein